MPICRGPSPLDMSYPNAQLSEDGDEYRVGSAVAVVRSDNVFRYELCGALLANYPESFCGFLSSLGATPRVSTFRGSLVVPIVENDVSLIPEQAVFLSQTPGRVTQTVPNGSGLVIMRIGFAISTTELILNTDTKYEIPA